MPRLHSTAGATLLAVAWVASSLPILAADPGHGEAGLASRLRAHVEFLASDALRGRGSASPDERVAAEYAAAALKLSGLQPAAPGGGFVQQVELVRQRLAGPPRLEVRDRRFDHGEAVAFFSISGEAFSGPLVRWTAGGPVPDVREKVVLVQLPLGADRAALGAVFDLLESGAVGVLVLDSPATQGLRIARSSRMPEASLTLAGAPPAPRALALLGPEASHALEACPEGESVSFKAPLAEAEKLSTWNALGRLNGSGSGQAVVLSAHLDHLGVKEGADDPVFNGADDDASGVAAVLELARLLAARGPARRTLLVALFGSEEKGGFGSRSFRESPPVPLREIVANLQFEMLGRPDPAVAAGLAWLTGFDRSELGPWLAKRGAALVADPHPEQDFFRRSDNYALAVKGVVAQTVSSYGLHTDYHRPSDEADRLDYEHMARILGSLEKPVRALLGSHDRPQWKPGRRP